MNGSSLNKWAQKAVIHMGKIIRVGRKEEKVEKGGKKYVLSQVWNPNC